MDIYVVLYDGSVCAIKNTFNKAKEYVCQEELMDEQGADWTEEDFNQYEKFFNDTAFVNGSTEYKGWWKIEKVELPSDIISWIKAYPVEFLEAAGSEDRTAPYEDKTASEEDDYCANLWDLWQEGDPI